MATSDPPEPSDASGRRGPGSPETSGAKAFASPSPSSGTVPPETPPRASTGHAKRAGDVPAARPNPRGGPDLLGTRRAVNRRTAAVKGTLRRSTGHDGALGGSGAATANTDQGKSSDTSFDRVIDPRTGMEVDELVTAEEVDDELTLAELDSRFVPPPVSRPRQRGRMVSREEFAVLGLPHNENRPTVIRRMAAVRISPRMMQWFLEHDDPEHGNSEDNELNALRRGRQIAGELMELVWTTYRLLDPRRRSDRYSQIALGRLLPNTLAAASVVRFTPPTERPAKRIGPQAQARWAAGHWADAGWEPVPTFWAIAASSDWRPLIDQLGWQPAASADPAAPVLDAEEIEVLDSVEVLQSPMPDGLDASLPKFAGSDVRLGRPAGRGLRNHPRRRKDSAALEELRRADSIRTLTDWLRDRRVVAAIATSLLLMIGGLWLGSLGEPDRLANEAGGVRTATPNQTEPEAAPGLDDAAGDVAGEAAEPPADSGLESWLRGVLTKIKRVKTEEARREAATDAADKAPPPRAEHLQSVDQSDGSSTLPPADRAAGSGASGEDASRQTSGLADAAATEAAIEAVDRSPSRVSSPDPVAADVGSMVGELTTDSPVAAVAGEDLDLAVVQEVEAPAAISADELEAAIDRLLIEYSFPLRLWDVAAAAKMQATGTLLAGNPDRPRLQRFAGAHLALRAAWLTEDYRQMLSLARDVASNWPLLPSDPPDSLSTPDDRWREMLVSSWIKCQQNVQMPEAIERLVGEAVPMIDEALLQDWMEVVVPVTQQLPQLYRLIAGGSGFGEPDVAAQAEQIVDAYRRVVAAEQTYSQDEASGAIFGRTECLLRRRWARGLEALARSSDPTLASIAAAEWQIRQVHGWSSVARLPDDVAAQLGEIGVRYARRADRLGGRSEGFNAMDREAASLRAHAIELLRESRQTEAIPEIESKLPDYLRERAES